MLMDGQWFCEKIGKVVLSFAPYDMKLTETYAISNRVKFFVNAFCAFGFDGISGDAMRAFVVTDNCCRWL